MESRTFEQTFLSGYLLYMAHTHTRRFASPWEESRGVERKGDEMEGGDVVWELVVVRLFAFTGEYHCFLVA